MMALNSWTISSAGVMVPAKLITADCHIAPPFELINELPEHNREYFPRIEKDENGKDVVMAGHIVSMEMMPGEGTESDITADATGAVGNVVSEALRASMPPSSSPTWNATASMGRY
jgi:hypothetical protein